MNRRQQSHRRPGFTFVELMIVAVVAAILVISAMPDAESSKRRTAFEFMQKFEADIAYAQNLSIARPDDPVVIRVDAAADAYWIARASAPDTPISHPSTGAPYIVTGGTSDNADYQGVDVIGANSGGTSTLVFDSTGGIDADASSFLQVSYGNTKLQMEIANATGAATITRSFTAAVVPEEGETDPEGEEGGLEETVDGLIDGIDDLGGKLLGR